MLKKLSILLLLLFGFSASTSYAVSFYDSLAGIPVIPVDHHNYYGENPFPGHIDILINSNDYHEDQFNTQVNQIFRNYYPNYESIEHLNLTDWVSYSAYYKNASFEVYDPVEGIHLFATQVEQKEEIHHVKVVYFDNEGNTIFISEAVEILHPKWYQSGSGFIYIDIDDQFASSTYHVGFSIFLVLLLIMGIFLAAALTFVKLLFAIILKNNIVNNPRVFLINYFIYILLISGLVVVFFNMSWTQDSIHSSLKGIILVSGFIIIETIIFAILFRKQESIIKLTVIYTICYLVITMIIGGLTMI